MITRRSALLTFAAAAAARPQSPTAPRIEGIDPEIIAQNDLAVQSYLERQNLDPDSRWRGAIPDATGLHQPGSASGVLVRGTASYFHPGSRFHRDRILRERIRLAADHLERVQTPDGNFDLLTTNFNSPPDTSFIMLNLGPAAQIARKYGDGEMFAWMEPVVRRAGEGLVEGGVHTPNHRWVACAALAITNEIIPDPRYVARAEQWLAEGVDIDSDGQYSEQSTTVYNAIVDNTLTTVAHLLDKPELLDPVRRNLEAMLYLIHPGYEVVTEISHRQDRNTVGNMGRYWLALRYLARTDGDGRFETLARAFEPRYASLAYLMVWDVLRQPGPRPEPIPDDYERFFPNTHLAHIRRGKTSASIITEGSSRIFALRRGQAVINGVRVASAFFGKAQLVPDEGERTGGVYRMKQHLEGPYFQPFEPSRKQPWGITSWYAMRERRPGREQTEVAMLDYEAEVREVSNGFDLTIRATGTDWVPIAVEINLREGGEIEGVKPAPDHPDAYLLAEGMATYRMGDDVIRFGPGIAETGYTQVRGAEPKLPGPSVYLTAYTPFDRTIRFRW